MLKLFRQRKLVVRIIFWVVVLVVGAMMVITLVPGLGQADLSLSDPQGLLARVGDDIVTQNDVTREYRLRSQQFGSDTTEFRRFLMQSIVDDLITQRVVEYEAQRLGFQVTPDEVRLQLQQSSVFYPNGQFVGATLYERIVQTQMNMTVEQFERRVRQQTLLAKAASWVTSGVSVSPAELELEIHRRRDTARIEYVLFQPDAYAQRLQPTEEELRGFYEANRARYQLPEKRSVRFVPIDTSQLSQRLPLDEAEVRAYYNSNRDRYRLPERVRARHVLFLRQEPTPAPPAGATEVAPAEDPLRKEADEALAKLRTGASFADVAGQHSDDTSTIANGGEIGWVQRGQTVPALEQVLFSVPSGSPPELVETSYGFHIVQVMEHEQERMRPLEEVRAEIESALKQSTVEREALAQARRIAEAARRGQTLEAAAGAEGWQVRDTPPFGRTENIPSLEGGRDFQEAAFRLPAASAGQPNAPVSDPVALPSGYSILQLKEVQPAHQATFEEVRGQVAQAYRQERGAEQARAAAQKLAAAAKSSGNLRSAARADGVEVQTSDPFGRLETLPTLGPVRDIATLVFSLPVGVTSEALSVNTNWVVFRVLERSETEPAQIPADEKETISNGLREQKRLLAWQVFTENARKRLEAEGKLKLNQAAIDRLVGSS